MLKILPALTVLLAGLAFSTIALADSESDAKAAFKRGVEAFADEDYPAALSDFEKAYELSGRAKILYNIAMCERALYRYKNSIQTFRKYIAELGDELSDEKKTEVLTMIEEMEARLGRLKLSGLPEGADVYVDGSLVGRAPLSGPVLVDPGEHRIQASMEGRKRAHKTVSVPAAAKCPLSLR